MKIRLKIHSVHFTIHFIFKGNILSSISPLSYPFFILSYANLNRFPHLFTPQLIGDFSNQSFSISICRINRISVPKSPAKRLLRSMQMRKFFLPLRAWNSKSKHLTCMYFVFVFLCISFLLDKIERETNALQLIHSVNYFWFIKLHHNPRSIFFF